MKNGMLKTITAILSIFCVFLIIIIVIIVLTNKNYTQQIQIQPQPQQIMVPNYPYTNLPN